MVDLNEIRLKNRFLVSAGAMGYGQGWPWERPLTKIKIPGYGKIIDLEAFGAIIIRTLTLESRHGNYIDPFEFETRSLMSHLCHISMSRLPYRDSMTRKILQKVPGGWVNNLGWWNCGIDYWIEEIYSVIWDISLIPNIGGFNIEDYIELIEKINPLDVVAIELNISCPNIESFWLKDPLELSRLFKACKKVSAHPLIIKLGIDCDYVQIAQNAEKSEINAISAINTVPVLGGGYSGKGIKTAALRVISELKKEISLPIIGGGGIYSWGDCQEFFNAGAAAVSFGSVHFFQPWRPTWITKMNS